MHPQRAEATLLQSALRQTLAVAAVRKAVQLAEARAARAPAFAPPATFYFYGAPGSGKTRLAEAAAERLGYPLHRLAMESYATVEDANALFGAPPGLQQGVCLVDLSLAARQPCRCRSGSVPTSGTSARRHARGLVAAQVAGEPASGRRLRRGREGARVSF